LWIGGRQGDRDIGTRKKSGYSSVSAEIVIVDSENLDIEMSVSVIEEWTKDLCSECSSDDRDRC
jgi:hypothetical protein